MAKFHSLSIADITEETQDSVSLGFSIPAELKEEYRFIQGQYLTLKMDINGEELRRSYSICSSPLEEGPIRVAVKKVKDGRVSTYLNDMAKAGESIEVMTPMGNFYTELKPTNRKHYVLFAGGSGITPMMSIIKTTLTIEEGSHITLFYGNLNEASIIFKNQLDELASQYGDRLKIYHILDQPANTIDPIFQGMMTGEKVKILLENFVERTPVIEYFVCGPGPMMDNVKNTLEELNVKKQFIHIEYFTATLDAEEQKAAAPVLGHSKSQVTVIMDDEETAFELASDGKVILDAAIEAGIDAPFSCKGAVCCTCKAKLMEGKVVMNMNYALSDEEVEEGYILTCQSHPVTPVVVVNYDEI